MTPFATRKEIKPCKFVAQARAIGLADAAAGDGVSPLPCSCAQCSAAYIDELRTALDARPVVLEADEKGRRIA